MKKEIAGLAALLCLLLAGCSSWMDGKYASVEPHMGQGYQADEEITVVSDYQQMRKALIDMVENAVESRTFSVAGIDASNVMDNMQLAIRYVKTTHPIGAYAVENIEYEQGTTGGSAAVVVTVEYNHNRGEILRMRQVQNMDEAANLITSALDQLEAGIVLQVSNYRKTDYTQLVQDYAEQCPEEVMEIPQVTANVYPESGLVRVVELQFTYQTSRESLKFMQNYVQPRFSSAALYVSGDDEESEKFARLYAFLMETGKYTVETSITPAYSLLRHYVGDSKAFAMVYSAMCRRAGLDCRIVSGTREGEPWFWNIICEDGVYYHVDLLRSYQMGSYQKLADADMAGYVWDYTAYPVCGPKEDDNTGDSDTTGEPEDSEATEEPDNSEDMENTEQTVPDGETTETTQADPTETTQATQSTEATDGGEE